MLTAPPDFWRFHGEVRLPSRPIETLPAHLTHLLENCPLLVIVQQVRYHRNQFTGDNWTSLRDVIDPSHAFYLIREYGDNNLGRHFRVRHFTGKIECEWDRKIYHALDVWREYEYGSANTETLNCLDTNITAVEPGDWWTPHRWSRTASHSLHVVAGPSE